MARTVHTEPPEGFQYLPDFLLLQEESEAQCASNEINEILERLEQLSFGTVKMHGVVAKRRVLYFGWRYGYESWQLTAGLPIPDWVIPLRDRVSSLINVPSMNMEQVLITQYPPGVRIGWHRDAPMFGSAVVGVSLLGHCRFQFQRTCGDIREVSECLLEPGSAYVLGGPGRLAWQHAIPPTQDLWYSMTFRTVKDAQGARAGQS